MAKGVFFLELQFIVEGKLRVEAMSEDDVAELEREDGGEAGLVWKHIEQTAAYDDGVAEGKGLQRHGHQDAALHFRLEVELVGDLKVVDYGV